jgi:hypothetical protein
MRYFLFLLLAASSIAPLSVHAQGALEPTAPPAPVMKTLDQVEPRTPIDSAGTISASGSYYLTNAITGRLIIAANDVDLDLQGFTVTGVNVFSLEILSVENVRVHNGTVRGSSSTSANISVSNASNVVLENLRVVDATNNAVQITDHSGLIVVRSVLVDRAGATGINVINNVDEPLDVVIEDNVVRDANTGIFVLQSGTAELTATIARNRALNNRGVGIGVPATGGGAASGAIIDNTVFGSGGTGFFIVGDLIVSKNIAQGNVTNYSIAAAPNAAPVSALASAGPWDNVEQ